MGPVCGAGSVDYPMYVLSYDYSSKQEHRCLWCAHIRVRASPHLPHAHRFQPSPEWLKMMQSVETELGELELGEQDQEQCGEQQRAPLLVERPGGRAAAAADADVDVELGVVAPDERSSGQPQQQGQQQGQAREEAMQAEAGAGDHGWRCP